MRLKKIVAAGLYLAFGSSALADLESIPPSTFQGDFYFYTFARKNGQPVCAERWRFSNGDTLIVYSGREVVTTHFRVQDGEAPFARSTKTWKSSRLVLSDPVSNGLPDCLGRTNTDSTGENIIYRASDGGIVLCVSGTDVMNCYGHLYRAADVDGRKP